MTEMLRIFNEYYEEIGIAEREEVHQKGLWHETFHCWLYEWQCGDLYVLLQLRAKEKKAFPNLFDVSSAGHIMAHERAADGTRELQEELGICVPEKALHFLGMFPTEVILPEYIDREFTNIYLYEASLRNNKFYLQEEEVAGLYKIAACDLKEIVKGRKKGIFIEGFRQKKSVQIPDKAFLSAERLCMHDAGYFDFLFQGLKHLKNERKS